MKALRSLWEAMLGRTRFDTAASDKRFYERLEAFKGVVDANTELLRSDHDRLEAKVDEQTKRINEIFSDLSRDDE